MMTTDALTGFVDSHCHLDQLDLSQAGENLHDLLPRWHEQGLEHVLCVCINTENRRDVLALAKQYDFISASVGVHPLEPPGNEMDTEALIRWGGDPHIVAIGETGLDYFKSEGPFEWQQQRFVCHIEAAKACRKPLIIHTRAANADTVRLLKAHHAGEVGGVFHCFAEDWPTARQGLDMGFDISFSGIVTFANARALREVAARVPLERMLIETDAPYLTPVPKRGKPNYPVYVQYVARVIAEIKGIEPQAVVEQTTDNYYRLFQSATAG